MSSPPTKFQRQFNFTDFSTDHPGDQQPGIDLDAELDSVKGTTDKIIDRLGEVQRDDGSLQNQIVTPDSLAPQTRAFMAAATGTPRGNWLTGTAYVQKDLVAQAGTTYINVIAHTSGVFATDLAAGKWMVFSAGSDATAIADAVAAANTATATAAAAVVTAESVMQFAVGAGTANALTAAFPITVTTLTDGLRVRVRALLANTTTTPTFKADATTARTITKLGGVALVAGDISGPLHELDLSYNLANTRWEVLNPSEPYGPVNGTGNLVKSSITDALLAKADNLAALTDKAAARTALQLKNGATTLITIQSGGSPPAGNDGDLCFIY